MATLPASSFAVASCCLDRGAKKLFNETLSTRGFMGGTVSARVDDKSDLPRILLGGSARLGTKCSVSKLSIAEVDKIERKQSPSYLLRTKKADTVRVIVEKKNELYLVHIEVSSSEINVDTGNMLVMSWGIYRSISSSFMPIDVQSSSTKSKKTTFEAALALTASGTYALDLVFESYRVPFFLSFLLKYVSGSTQTGTDIKNHLGRNFCVPVGFGSGSPSPLGASFSSDGSINFALFSQNAQSVVLCLFDDHASEKPALEIELDPYVNRTGKIWHVNIDTEGRYLAYGYRCKGPGFHEREGKAAGPILLDPYAMGITSSRLGHLQLGELHEEPAFDWSGDLSPNLPMEKLVVYRLNVMSFTKDKSSKLSPDVAGTFLGVEEKLQHFKDLGINAILLEPIVPFDEKTGPYFPLHFFSVSKFYGTSSSSLSATKSMKEMVKAMHRNGMEVYLEVVFTHAAKGCALQEIDYSSYIYADGVEDQGSGVALSCNYPIVQQFILENLRFWVTEFHVDGFCFMNASYLLRGFHGEELSRPLLVEAITYDPILAKTKIIADCWDPHNLCSKPVSFPHWKRWAEMNTNFCSDVRNFVRSKGILSSLATRLCGSGDIFSDGRGPAYSFNFIARNFGLPLVDLVSFSVTDLAPELSWNCGEEGPTSKRLVLERRLKQIRNLLFILFVSLGVPVLNMGDECGQSAGGSPAYADRRHLNWKALNTAFGVQTTQFIAYLISLRKRRSDLLQKKSFLKQEMIGWHGSDLSPPSWDDPSAKFLAMTLKAENEEDQLKGDLYIAFNASDKSESVLLPGPPGNVEWVRLVDTALPFPGFFSSMGEPVLEQMPGLLTYEVQSYSCVMFEAKWLPASA